MIDHYMSYLSDEIKRSGTTIRGYGSDLQSFERWLDERNMSALNVDVNVAAEYLRFLNSRGLKTATVHRAIAACRSLYKWAIRRKLIADNPFAVLELPSIGDRLPRYIEIFEFEKLVSFPLDCPTAIRDKSILELLVSTAIRVGELEKLNMTNLNMTHLQIRLVLKRNKERIIPFGLRARNALLSYLATRRELVHSTNEPALFVNQYGERMHQGGIQYMMRGRSVRMLGYTVTPHQLRHSCATWMLNGGAPLEGITELLGHSDISITRRIYAHMNLTRMREIHQASHPLEQIGMELPRLTIVK